MGWCGAQVAKLRAYHYTAQTKPEKAGLNRYGLDLIKGALRNNVEAGVLEPVLAKLKIIQVTPATSHTIRARPCTSCTCSIARRMCISWLSLACRVTATFKGNTLCDNVVYAVCHRGGDHNIAHR